MGSAAWEGWKGLEDEGLRSAHLTHCGVWTHSFL